MMLRRISMISVSLVALLSACGGEDGEDGDNGEDGAAGVDGENGERGEDGENGAKGAKGDPGDDGDRGLRGPSGTPGNDGDDGAPGMDLTAAPKLTRLATVPLAAEVTGMFKADTGDFFFNVQHPSTSLPGPENLAAVGVWTGLDMDHLDPMLESLEVPDPTSAAAQTVQVVTGAYQVLGREGDTYSGDLALGLGHIVAADGSTSVKQSPNPDFNAFVASTADGSEGFLFTAWEDRPGGVSRLAIAKQDDGTWDVSGALNVDFSAVEGTIINCFGTLSPWGTPLTSEENYEAENTWRWIDSSYTGGYPSYGDVQAIQTYLGGTYPNPYDYGYIVEITDPKETPVPVKLFTMGRMAHENPVIMPDHKTVYLTDDGGFKGFYKFVADTAGDMSVGTLYAAKVSQDSTTDPAKAGFDISWIELGHASNAEIESWIDEYDGYDEGDFTDEAGSPYIGAAEIAAYAAGTALDDRVAFLESLKAAEAMGATMEFNKMEGININYGGAANGTVPFMYVAMSDIAGSMADDVGDIQLEQNRCGVVYQLGLTSTFDVLRMEPVVVGGAYDGTKTVDRCDVDGISSPDNIEVLDDGRVLIGEDTSTGHATNMIWVYNPMGK